MSEKIKIAINRGATCSGCDIAVLDLDEHILDLTAIADIVFAGQPGCLVGKLEKDGRLGVGVANRVAAVAFGGGDYLRGADSLRAGNSACPR